MDIRQQSRVRVEPGHMKTVVVSDVVRSTEMLDTVGDGAWLDIIGDHTALVSSAAASHGGEVIAFVGDGFILMFDDPDEGFDCATDLQRAVARGPIDGLRIGVDHGLVYPFRDTWWVGLTLHLAARLAELAEPGTIAMSDRSVQHLRRPMRCTSVQTSLQRIRGMCEPCYVHRVEPRQVALTGRLDGGQIARPAAYSAP